MTRLVTVGMVQWPEGLEAHGEQWERGQCLDEPRSAERGEWPEREQEPGPGERPDDRRDRR